MSNAQIHYNIDNIDKKDANFNLIYGEKSNGKSYQVKHKKAVEHYLKTGRRFILLRRWREDISNLWIEQYFADVDVAKLTNNKYNCISQYRKVLYFSIYDENTGKTQRIEKIGYVMSLSTEQHMSSASFLDVDIIIFEEFMERGTYIPHEPDRLMIFYSTIDRKRGTTKIYMVGNSISRVCPYIKEWGLDNIFRNLKQGEIEVKEIQNEENKVKIAIEYCKSSGGKTMAIGNASSMVDKGSWQTFPQPKLPKSYNEYNVLFRFGFQYKGFRFLCDYLEDKVLHETIFFVYPHQKEFRENIFVFSDEIRVSSYWQRDIYNISIKNDKLRNLFMKFKENKIFFSSDLCGTDFKQVIDFMIRK
jgi:hypothetical protein